MKKIIAVLIIMVITVAGWNVYAYNFPSSFWEVNSKYENAFNSNNHNAIIEYGNKIINLMNSATSNIVIDNSSRDITVEINNE